MLITEYLQGRQMSMNGMKLVCIQCTNFNWVNTIFFQPFIHNVFFTSCCYSNLERMSSSQCTYQREDDRKRGGGSSETKLYL